MSRQRDDLRILLMQIREDPRVRVEEHESFSDYARVGREQIDILNVFDTPHFEPAVINGYDALFVGGASAASVLQPDEYPFLQSGRRLMRHCIDEHIPVFASCFGFQMAVLELGGDIVRHEEDFEMGTLPIAVTQHGHDDPVFGRGERELLAVAVHQESAVHCPPGCVELARTERFCHSFRVQDRPFWAFQFHPELDKSRLVERLTIYKAGYTDGDDHLDEIISGLEETPESNELLEAFIERVLLTFDE